MIKGVLFDLFETLITEANACPPRASALGQRLGVDPHDYRREWKARRSDVVLGRCSFWDALDQIARTLGVTPQEAVLEEIRSERIGAKAAILRSVEPAVLDMLKALRARGLKLALVTNSFPEDVAGWARSPLQAFFDAAVFSFAVGRAKPDPHIYLLACRDIGAAPADALFIGDGGDDELTGARDAGLKARQALWYLRRRPHGSMARADAGFLCVGDVLWEMHTRGG